jgi:Glycosyl transferase family 2
VAPCLEALLAQVDGGAVEYLILDDRSSDGTGDLVRATVGGDPRFRVLDGVAPEAGWLGKPWACHQLAGAAAPDSEVLVFVDADVVLRPTAVAATVQLLADTDLDLISPYPRQRAETGAERLIQPLLQWSWLTTLPLRHAERSPRESLAAANGQLLAVRRTAYAEAGGHAAVRAEVLDDVALLRAVKRIGGTGGVVDGTALADCRMYDGWEQLRDGYTKSLWCAFGSPPRAAAVLAFLGLAYLVPPLAALRGSTVGAIGYGAGVAGRVMVARRVGGRVWPDSLAHPVSIAVLSYLTGLSHLRRRQGRLRWKDRPVEATR